MIKVLEIFILFSGFVIGLGAVTVIDVHGFLGRKSPYWTAATISAHKVTKPLIWIGTIFVIIGGYLFYKDSVFSWPMFFHIIAALVLLLNGSFLSFVISPRLLDKEINGRNNELLPESWQRKIFVSLILSDIFWWVSLLLFIYQLVK